jgi:hypothetical protein
MDAAQNLFDTLSGFKKPDESGKTTETRLIEYWKQILGAQRDSCRF